MADILPEGTKVHITKPGIFAHPDALDKPGVIVGVVPFYEVRYEGLNPKYAPVLMEPDEFEVIGQAQAQGDDSERADNGD
jgi:hypothetical protein